jgi:hypothetical protein
MKFKLAVLIVILSLTNVFAQKKKEKYDYLNIYTGFSLLKSAPKPPNASFEHILGIEFQKSLTPKSKLSAGLEIEYQYLYIFRDSNVYELLRKSSCLPNGGFSGGLIYCPYYYTKQYINLNIPISYIYQLYSSKNFEFFVKGGLLFRFNFFEHRNETYPKLDQTTGVLLDAGPFNANYSRTDFYFLNYDVTLGSGLSYKISKNLQLSAIGEYRRSFEGSHLPLLYRSNKFFLKCGLEVKI